MPFPADQSGFFKKIQIGGNDMAYKSNIKTVATGYGMRGKNSHPIFLVWREWECSLKSEYPFAKYFLFVIVMSISVCSGTPRPADKQKSDERW